MALYLRKYGSTSIIIYSLPLLLELRGVNGRPALLIASQVNDAVTWPVILLISIASIMGLVFTVFGCLCCRRNKFTNVLVTPRNGVSTVQETAVAVVPGGGSTHEFTMFPPPVGHSGPNDEVRFDPLPDIRPRPRRTLSGSPASKPKPATFSNAVNRGIPVQDWFDDPYSNFPRSRLQYLRQLGSGWFGQVVEGEAQGIVSYQKKVKVVVKILQEDATPTDQMYFLHEARPFRDSDHPNVLKLLGKCLESDPFLVILEHCALKNLKSYLMERRRNAEFETVLRENFLLRAVNNIAAGLQYLHSKDFIHTDLASRNCLVTADCTVKIGDYGNSIELFKGDYYCAGGIAVPIRWCAPETLRCTDTIIETREVTKQANIWSFGIVIWEVLEFGKLPYLELSDDEVIKNVIVEKSHRPEPPRIRSPHVDRIFRVSQSCHADPRLSLDAICEALSFLLTVPDGGDPSGDFETRWRRLNSRESAAALSSLGAGGGVGDLSVSSRETSPFSWQQTTSVSLQNLRGSLEDVSIRGNGEQAREDESLNLSLQVTQVIQHFDEMLLQDGQQGDGQETRVQEDLSWKRMVESNMQESGQIKRLIREKSQSVQDFLKLTVVDSSESGSDSEPGGAIPQQLSASEPTLDIVSTSTKTSQHEEVKVKSGTDPYTRATTATTPPPPTHSFHHLHPGHVLDGGGGDGGGEGPQELWLNRWAGDMVNLLVKRAMEIPSIRVHDATTRATDSDSSNSLRPQSPNPKEKAPPQMPFNFRFQNDTEEELEEEASEGDDKDPSGVWLYTSTPLIDRDRDREREKDNVVLDLSMATLTDEDDTVLRFQDATRNKTTVVEDSDFIQTGIRVDSRDYDEDEDDDEILLVNTETNEAVLMDSPRSVALAAKAAERDAVSSIVVEAPSGSSGSSSSLSLLWSASDLAEWGSEASLRHSGASSSWLVTMPDVEGDGQKDEQVRIIVEEVVEKDADVPYDAVTWSNEEDVSGIPAQAVWKKVDKDNVDVESEVTYVVNDDERTFDRQVTAEDLLLDGTMDLDREGFTEDNAAAVDVSDIDYHVLSTVWEVEKDFDETPRTVEELAEVDTVETDGKELDWTVIVEEETGHGNDVTRVISVNEGEDDLNLMADFITESSDVAVLSVDDIVDVIPVKDTDEGLSLDVSESSSVWWKEEEEEKESSDKAESGEEVKDGCRYTPDWESESDSEADATASATSSSSPASSSSTSGEFFCLKTTGDGNGIVGPEDGDGSQTADDVQGNGGGAVEENGDVDGEVEEDGNEYGYNGEGGEYDGDYGDEDDADDDGSSEQITLSTWDRHATPSKGLLRSPEKRSEEKKSVSFKAQTRKVIYQYPREEVDEERYVETNPQHPFWMMIDQNFDYNSYADWVMENDQEDMVDVDDLEDCEEFDLSGGAQGDHYQSWDHRPLVRTDDQTQAHELYRLGGMTMAEEEDDEDYDLAARGEVDVPVPYVNRDVDPSTALAFYNSHEAYNLATLLARYGAEGTDTATDSTSTLTEEEMWLEAILNAGNFYVSGTDSPFDFFPGNGDLVQWQVDDEDGDVDARRGHSEPNELEVSFAEETGEDELEQSRYQNGDTDDGHDEERFQEYDDVFNVTRLEAKTGNAEELESELECAGGEEIGGVFQSVRKVQDLPLDGESNGGVSEEWNGVVDEGTNGEQNLALAMQPGQQVQLGCSNARSVESTA